MKQYRSTTTYFLTEGKVNLLECLRVSFKKAAESGIPVVVIYTSNGEGLELACSKFLTQDEYSRIRIVGVCMPIGSAPVEALRIPRERAELLQKHNVVVVRAAGPFDGPQLEPAPSPNLVRRAFECFSGGMALCLSAAVIACDAGAIVPGSHVISMSADTSVVVKAVPSSHALSALVVREIICKPTILDISKKEIVASEVNAEALLSRKKPKGRILPMTASDSPKK